MFDLDLCLKMGSKIQSRSLVWKKNLSHFFVKWSDMISDHLKSDHPILWKSVVHIKDWYVPKRAVNLEETWRTKANILQSSEVRVLCLIREDVRIFRMVMNLTNASSCGNLKWCTKIEGFYMKLHVQAMYIAYFSNL